jgi:hypothetical protein
VKGRNTYRRADGVSRLRAEGADAQLNRGRRATMLSEEGADQGDINTLIGGVLTGLDYTVKPDWRELVLP